MPVLKNLAKIDVKDFGATGDGVTDDSAAIRYAFESATSGTVYFPPGTYRTAPVLVPSGFNIEGDGTSSVLMSIDVSGFIIQIANGVGNFVRNLTINGIATAKNASNTGVRLDSCRKALVEGVQILGGIGGTGIQVKNCTDVTVKGCFFEGNWATGVTVYDKSTDIIVDSNHFNGLKESSVQVLSQTLDGVQVSRVVITNNTVLNNTNRGIVNYGGRDVVIANNTIESTSSAAIMVHLETTLTTYAPENTIVLGNVIANAGNLAPTFGNKTAIEISTSAINTQIIGNIIRDSNGAGILVNAVSGVSILNNTLLRNITGVFIDNATTLAGLRLIGNRAELNFDAGFNMRNVKNSVISSNVSVDNNVGNVAGTSNFRFINCTDNIVSNNQSHDTRTPVRVTNGYHITGSTNMALSNNLSNNAAVPFLFQTCVNTKREPFTLTALPGAGEAHYAAGQMAYFGTTLYCFDGTVWRTHARYVAVPATATAGGAPGDIAADAGFIYICHAANTWKRVAVATW